MSRWKFATHNSRCSTWQTPCNTNESKCLCWCFSIGNFAIMEMIEQCSPIDSIWLLILNERKNWEKEKSSVSIGTLCVIPAWKASWRMITLFVVSINHSVVDIVEFPFFSLRELRIICVLTLDFYCCYFYHFNQQLLAFVSRYSFDWFRIGCIKKKLVIPAICMQLRHHYRELIGCEYTSTYVRRLKKIIVKINVLR